MFANREFFRADINDSELNGNALCIAGANEINKIWVNKIVIRFLQPNFEEFILVEAKGKKSKNNSN